MSRLLLLVTGTALALTASSRQLPPPSLSPAVALHSIRPSSRSDVASFKVMDVVAAAAEMESRGERVIHLEVGQPQSAAPKAALKAAAEALEMDRLGYTEARGILPLRQAIADMYAKKYGVRVPASRVHVTTGSSSGFILSFLSAFDAGDSVAVASSSYPCYRNIMDSLGINVVTLEANSEYKITADEVREAAADPNVPRLSGLILSSPSNPTGAQLSPAEIEGLCTVCNELGIRFLSDETLQGGPNWRLLSQMARALGGVDDP